MGEDGQRQSGKNSRANSKAQSRRKDVQPALGQPIVSLAPVQAANPLADPQAQPIDTAALEDTTVVPLHASNTAVPTPTDGPPTLMSLPLMLKPHERVILRELTRYVLLGGVAYFVVSLLWNNIESLIPFIVGLALAYVALPLVNRLGRSMPRWAAILCVYGLTFLSLAAIVAYIVPPLSAEVRDLVTTIPNLDVLQGQADGYLDRLRNALPESLRQPLDVGISRGISTLQTNLTSYLSRIGTIVLNTVLQVLDTLIFLFGFLVVPFWLFYILSDADAGLKAVDRLIPTAIRDDFWALARIIDNVFSKYIRGQLILGVIVGTLVGIGLFVLNLLGFEVNYIILLALFAGITELIPVIGPIIGAIPAIALGLFDGIGTAVAVTILYLLIQQVENQVLVPRITGESVGISPALMFVLLAVGAQAYGLLGAILAAPVAAALRDVVVYLNQRLSNPRAAEIMQEATSSRMDASAIQPVSIGLRRDNSS
jgi:predicted PurR-regulated permease PerM